MSKGRDKNLISKRNEQLLRRYYYWTEVQRLRFDDAIKVLSEQEFFISEDRVITIIRENCQKITDIAVKPVPKVKQPKVTVQMLKLLKD